MAVGGDDSVELDGGLAWNYRDNAHVAVARAPLALWSFLRNLSDLLSELLSSLSNLLSGLLSNRLTGWDRGD